MLDRQQDWVKPADHLVDCVLKCGFRHGCPIQDSNQQTRWSAGWLAWIAEWLSSGDHVRMSVRANQPTWAIMQWRRLFELFHRCAKTAAGDQIDWRMVQPQPR
jgi:hypothetical protein